MVSSREVVWAFVGADQTNSRLPACLFDDDPNEDENAENDNED